MQETKQLFKQLETLTSHLKQRVNLSTNILNEQQKKLKEMNKELMKQRIKHFSGNSNYSGEKHFYGSHDQKPPTYQSLIHSDYPPGIEKVKAYKGEDFYVFHFSIQNFST